MTCRSCGYQWESHARSQKSRCGRCRAVVYVPASVRHANSREPAGRGPSAPPASRRTALEVTPPARAGEIETFELPGCRHQLRVRLVWPVEDDVGGWERLGAVNLTCPVCGARTAMSEVLGYSASAPVCGSDHGSSPAARRDSPVTDRRTSEPLLPGAWAARGALGRWQCGHEALVPVTVDDRHPEIVPCPECGDPGLSCQRTPQGWAEVVAR